MQQKFEALSSACQIVNERLLEFVQPEQKNKAELMPFMQLFSNHHAALECTKHIAQHLYNN